MGPIGAQEMFAIVIVALLLFGPKKLPELAKLLGKGLTEFRRAKNELKSTLETHMAELDREVRASEYESQTKQIGKPAAPYTPVSYPYRYEDSAPYESPVSQTPPPPVTPRVEGAVARSSETRPAPPAPTPAQEERPA